MAVLRTGYSSDRNKSGELQTKGNEGNEGEKRLNGLRAQAPSSFSSFPSVQFRRLLRLGGNLQA
jgi:hypothetical protein